MTCAYLCCLTAIAIITDVMVGLSKGGHQITKCKEAFLRALDLLIKLASLQVSVEGHKCS